MITEVSKVKFDWLYCNYIDYKHGEDLNTYIYFKNFIYPVLNRYINLTITPEMIGLYAFNNVSRFIMTQIDFMFKRINDLANIISTVISSNYYQNNLSSNYSGVNGVYYNSYYNNESPSPYKDIQSSIEEYIVNPAEIQINRVLSSLNNYELIAKLRLEVLKYTFNLLVKRLLVIRYNDIDMNKVTVKVYLNSDKNVAFPLYSDKNYLTRVSIYDYHTIKEFVDGFFPYVNSLPSSNYIRFFDLILGIDIYHDEFCFREINEKYLDSIEDKSNIIVKALENHPDKEINDIVTELSFYNEKFIPEPIYKVYEWKDNYDKVIFE